MAEKLLRESWLRQSKPLASGLVQTSTLEVILKSFPAQIFEHENCEPTNPKQNTGPITVTEHLQEECGDGTVYLAYDYKHSVF